MRLLPLLALAAAFSTLAANVVAALRLPTVFSEHMVLQTGATAPIWGWAEPCEEIIVTVAGREARTRAGMQGRWQVAFADLPRGGPHELIVRGRDETRRIGDVLVGEVWLGSGQSNMVFPFRSDGFPPMKIQHYEAELCRSDVPEIRMFIVESELVAERPQEECEGRWHVASPENIDRFSAVLYFFGRRLHEELHTPVGLILSAVGGTGIDLWIDADAQRASPRSAELLRRMAEEKRHFDPTAARAKYAHALSEWEREAAAARVRGERVPRRPSDPIALHHRAHTPGGLFNRKIAPLIPYGLRGVLWYQGEHDGNVAWRAPYYRDQLSLLVADWRARWGATLPFAWVQLPNYARTSGDWPTVREAMRTALANLPNTGMVVTIDIGDADDIHPANKQEVARRLALWALATVYARGGDYAGPLFATLTARADGIEICFTHTAGGLVAREGELRGFSVLLSDGRALPARARIDGERVVVSTPSVGSIVSVRYAWENNPDGNLCNGAGLPASPFAADCPPPAETTR